MFQHDVRKSTARDKLTPPGHQWAMAQFRAAEREAGKGGGDMGVKTYVLKAVVGGDGGTAVGFGVVRVVKQMGRVGGGEEEGDGEGEGEKGETGGLEADADADADANANEVLNRAFCDVYLLRLKGLYERHMGGREHARRFFQPSPIPHHLFNQTVPCYPILGPIRVLRKNTRSSNTSPSLMLCSPIHAP